LINRNKKKYKQKDLVCKKYLVVSNADSVWDDELGAKSIVLLLESFTP
jgi:hypothetical protein